MPNSYFENALATVSEHPDDYVVFTYRAGEHNLTDLQQALTYTGNLLYQREWHRVLLDQRLMTTLTPTERAVIAAYWLEQTQPDGYGICVASILAQDVFARLSATQLRAEMQEANVAYNLFADELSASAWLRQQTICPPLEQ